LARLYYPRGIDYYRPELPLQGLDRQPLPFISDTQELSVCRINSAISVHLSDKRPKSPGLPLCRLNNGLNLFQGSS
jgi:hypothetical protein